MSLTSELKRAESPVSQWFMTHIRAAPLADCIRYVNDTLAQRWVARPPGTDPSLAGMTFDYVFRWLLGALEAQVARDGARQCAGYGWPQATAVVDALIAMGDQDDDLRTRAALAIGLSWFEIIYRTGSVPPALTPFVGQDVHTDIVADILATVPQATADDVAALATTVPAVWGDDLQLPFIMNPTFVGSHLVGGADADWIAGTTLYDCKCSARRRPFDANHLYQLLGYVLLDIDGHYDIHRIGWYFARQQERVTLPLPALLERLCGTRDLSALRHDFISAIQPQVPVTRRRQRTTSS